MGQPGFYQAQAAIAACHATSRRREDTDWHLIVSLYDQLLAAGDSPVAALNRAIALQYRDGPEVALAALRHTDHRVAARLDGQHQDEPVSHTTRYTVGDNRIDITLDDGSKSSLWWATKNEWLGLLDVAGLELEALHGGFAGEPFDDDSREYVFVARR